MVSEAVEQEPFRMRDVLKNMYAPEDLIKRKKPFYLNQSLVRKIINKFGEENPYCPHQIYKVDVLQEYQRPGTTYQDEGSYAETLCLGASAGGRMVTDLPRHKKTGEKLAAQKRIEAQVINFRNLCVNNMITIVPGHNTQIPISKKFNDKLIFRGELDIFPTPVLWEDKLRVAIIDLKFTGDISNTFGDYCWGDPVHMDHIQGDAYQWLIRDFDFELNKKLNPEFEERVGYKNVFTDQIISLANSGQIIFLYWVFNYRKEELENKFVQRMYDDPARGDFRQKEFMQRVDQCIKALHEDRLAGFKTLPSEENCKKCPVSAINGGTCKDYPKVEKV